VKLYSSDEENEKQNDQESYPPGDVPSREEWDQDSVSKGIYSVYDSHYYPQNYCYWSGDTQPSWWSLHCLGKLHLAALTAVDVS
jgi:hypothetical protein